MAGLDKWRVRATDNLVVVVITMMMMMMMTLFSYFATNG
jgi:hypothetical protein